ncbi:hypothetical protein GCM10009718_18000 [Isoptericola halotolerans]
MPAPAPLARSSAAPRGPDRGHREQHRAAQRPGLEQERRLPVVAEGLAHLGAERRRHHERGQVAETGQDRRVHQEQAGQQDDARATDQDDARAAPGRPPRTHPHREQRPEGCERHDPTGKGGSGDVAEQPVVDRLGCGDRGAYRPPQDEGEGQAGEPPQDGEGLDPAAPS